MATTQVETVSTGADKAKVGAATLVIASLAGFYLLARRGSSSGRCFVDLAAAVAVFLTSSRARNSSASSTGCRQGNEDRLACPPEAIQMTATCSASS